MDLLVHFGVETVLAVIIISIATTAMHVAWSRKIGALGPTVLTTMGIFFCFLGIAIGLLDFDSGDVRQSVPALLNGIRTAFWASVFGIFGALTIKLRLLFRGEPELSADAPSGATVDDLVVLLERMNRSLAGNEDSTLLSQTKLLRADTNDRLDRLNSSFERFAEKMAEANSKALIQALSEVIRDFNTKLNEQFGENFKQLNQAVSQLVIWQKQYEQQLNLLIEQETATRKTMTEASLRYAELVNKTEVFATTSSALEGLLKALDVQRGQIQSSVEQLARLIDKTTSGLPQIESKVVEMARQMDSAVKQNADVISATLKAAATSMTTSSTHLADTLTRMVDRANSDLSAHVKKMSEDTNKQIVALDTALERELTKSIESLGRQLTALSQKFVEDYTPLTDRLRNVLNLARANA